MSRRMLVDAVHPEETRVVITDNKSTILEFDFTTASKPQIKGNVYLAKVTRVEPSLQAAFVEYGGGKQGFLPFAEIHPNYYQIPVSDRQRLIEEEEAEAAMDMAEEEAEIMVAEDDLEPSNDPAVIAEKAAIGESVSSEIIVDDEEDEVEQEVEVATEPAAEAEAMEPQAVAEDAETTEGEAGEAAEAVEGKSDGEGEERNGRRRRRGGRFRNRRRRDRDREGRPEGEEGGEVEVLSSEDEIERPRRKRDYTRRYKIQEVIKRNQVLLVQVIKEERGNKGVSLTTFLSLAGRYCVLMPNSPRGGGVSRKIASSDDRKRLKSVLAELELPTGMSVIIRTAGAGHTRTEVKRDFDYLVKLWNQIREDTLKSSAPAMVYEESNIVQRCIRDSYNNDIEEVIVDGEDAFKETKNFMRQLIPSHAPRVKLHKGDAPLFHEEGIDNQLLSMTEPEVRLRSGGSIVMMPTEALISIDVNSGRSTRERNVEETALKTNLEAAREIARQLRLRDLAGLIVIDFIDMMEGKNRRAVERAMKEALRHDRAKIQVGRISTFGLMEMSRQRMRPSISESMNRTCPHCQGTGYVRSEAALGIQIIRALEKEASSDEFDRFRVSVTAGEALYILNNMRSELDKIEADYECSVEIVIDGALHEGNFRIEKFRRKGGERSDAPSTGDNNESGGKRSRRRGGRNRRDRDRNRAEEETEELIEEEAEAEAENESEVKAEEPVAAAEEKPARKQGRRSRKPRESKAKSTDEAAADKGKEAATETDETEEKPKKGRTPRKRGGRRKAEDKTSDKETTEPKLVKSEEKTEKASANDDAKPAKPAGPKRSGWWQKIVE